MASDRLLEKHWFSISKHTTKSKSAQFLLEFNKFKMFRKQRYAVDSTLLDIDCGIVEVRAWREDCKSESLSPAVLQHVGSGLKIEIFMICIALGDRSHKNEFKPC